MLAVKEKPEAQYYIGRFLIKSSLGKGAQGEVFLARDPELERDVAIKAMVSKGVQSQSLLQEAKMVSKLQHPNIVTLYDVVQHDSLPYLVYAYVKGQTLANYIKQQSSLPMSKAVQILLGVLDAIQYAHEHQVLHLDLKPANIMLSEQGEPLVMDFGIARTFQQAGQGSAGLIGSPQYIAPEIIRGDSPSIRSDIFSLGMMLYEMVTGKPAVEGDNIYEILHKLANETNAAPSAHNQKVDGQLEALIQKALAKDPEQRFSSVAALKEALQAYLNPTAANEEETGGTKGTKNSTVEFILRRMRTKSDFPALSTTITDINRVVNDDKARSTLMSKCILQDFSLTNKILKMVNTAIYSQFGGRINTISKAVAILGFDTVRSIATSLILFDFLQNKAQAQQLKDDVMAAFFSGIVAAHVATGRSMRDAEEAMICSMFRNLGKMLASMYLFEDSQEVERLMEQGETEDRASYKVLGISYHDLGIEIAKQWNFPQRIIAGMAKLSGDKIPKPNNELDNLAVTVNLANDLCHIARNGKPEDKPKALKSLSTRYAQAFPISEQELGKALEKGLADLATRASVVGGAIYKTSMMKRINRWSGATTIDPNATAIGLEAESDHVSAPSSEAMIQRITESESLLSSGIQDVTNALVEDIKLNDLIQMVLETMYRGLGFDHVLVMVRDMKTQKMVARFGFGAGVESILPRFQFALSNQQDVFQLAVSKGLDILIEDVNAPNMSGKIPSWYAQLMKNNTFILLPVMVNKNPVGLFYADMKDANAMKMSEKQHASLRTLRNQVVLAIKQK